MLQNITPVLYTGRVYSRHINCRLVAVLSRTLRGGGTVRPGRFQSHDLLRPEIEIEGFLLLILFLILLVLLTMVSPSADKRKAGRRGKRVRAKLRTL